MYKKIKIKQNKKPEREKEISKETDENKAAKDTIYPQSCLKVKVSVESNRKRQTKSRYEKKHNANFATAALFMVKRRIYFSLMFFDFLFYIEDIAGCKVYFIKPFFRASEGRT